MTKRKRPGGGRRFFTFIGVVVVLVAGAAVGLRLWLTPDRLRTMIVHAASDATGLDVLIDDARLSLVPLGVSIRNLRIQENEDTPFVELESGLLRLELAPLLRKQIAVERLTLRRPRLYLTQVEEEIVLPGRLGDPAPGGGAGGPSSGGAGFGSTIRDFEIVDGSFRLATPGGADDVTLDGIEMAGSLEVRPGSVASVGTLSLAGLSLAALESYQETLDRLDPGVAYDVLWRQDQGTVRLDELRIVAKPLDLRFHGDIRGLPDAPEVALTLDEQTVELSELLPLVPPALIPEGRVPTGKGPVTVSAKIDGPLGNPEAPPAVTGKLRFGGADLGMEGFPAGITGVEGLVSATTDRLVIEDLRGGLGEGSFAVRGEVTGIDQPGAARYALAIEGDLDLGLAQSTGFLPDGTELSGRLDVNVSAKGSAATPDDVQLDGAVSLRGARYRGPEMAVPVHDLAGELVLAGPRIELTSLTGGIGSSRFSVSGEVLDVPADPKIRLTGSAPKLDLVELAPAGGPTGAPAGDDGAPVPSAPLVPPLPPFTWTLGLQVDSLVTAGGLLSDVKLTARIADRKARVETKVGVGDFDGVVMSDLEAGVDVVDQTVRGDFHSPRIAAHMVPLTGVSGLIDLGEDRVLNIDHVRGGVWTGRVEGRARVDLARPGEPVFDIETKALGLEANDFISSMTSASDVLFGKLDIQSRFSGRGATPQEVKWSLQGNGSVATSRGRVAKTKATSAVWDALNLGERDAIPFEDLVTSFKVRDGKLVTDDLAIAGSDADWKASGFITFEGALAYDVQVELSQALSRQYRKRAKGAAATALGLLSNENDRLVLDFTIEGDPGQRPHVAVDYDKLAQRAGASAVDKAVGEIGKWFKQ